MSKLLALAALVLLAGCTASPHAPEPIPKPPGPKPIVVVLTAQDLQSHLAPLGARNSARLGRMLEGAELIVDRVEADGSVGGKLVHCQVGRLFVSTTGPLRVGSVATEVKPGWSIPDTLLESPPHGVTTAQELADAIAAEPALLATLQTRGGSSVGGLMGLRWISSTPVAAAFDLQSETASQTIRIDFKVTNLSIGFEGQLARDGEGWRVTRLDRIGGQPWKTYLAGLQALLENAP